MGNVFCAGNQERITHLEDRLDAQAAEIQKLEAESRLLNRENRYIRQLIKHERPLLGS